jgi:hypothetical protein
VGVGGGWVETKQQNNKTRVTFESVQIAVRSEFRENERERGSLSEGEREKCTIVVLDTG